MDGRRRVVFERELRVFCGYCPASWPGKKPPLEAVQHLMAAHRVYFLTLGVELYLGARYGAGTGNPKRRPGRRKKPVTPERTWGIE